MNKKNLNKKGSETTLWIVIFIIIGLVVLGFAVSWIIKGVGQVNIIDTFSSVNDFDNDGKYDLMDECPLRSYNNKKEINSKAWCVAGYTQDQCKCAQLCKFCIETREKKQICAAL